MNVYDLTCIIYDNYIKTDRQRLWLDYAISKSNIIIYTNAEKEYKDFFDDYCNKLELDKRDFRALAWSNGTIVLNNLYETKESLCWLLLHELGHVTVHSMEQAIDIEVLKMLSGGALNELTKEQYKEYSSNDEVHEARYEEQFANQFANVIIGKNYDRHWWRKYKNDKM